MLPREIEVFPKNPEILRSIERGHIEFIQRNIKVNYNNKLQSPVSFYYEDKEHKVIEAQGIFRGEMSPRDVSYLVKTQSGDLYLLHLHFFDAVSQGFLTACRWVLGFRVLKDEELMSLYREEKAMLVDIRLKIVADFHGHLCPDLVIGWRACRLALEVLAGEGQIQEDLTIITENSTAALDAIQYTLGCTIGNQRLQIVDTGQHNYTLIINKTSRRRYPRQLTD
ncbi:MAG: formylmethanofuran dehydrogenase subunit E family protein, partial [Thermodesulfobacteriota bacterium]|nr:formylmethanofuran dehydrogenase subunit E family protein [Thermodesulfobacteriota bacterium]